jgi:N,N'-diacetyl-8-epilegionaminate cytidylyltransferase
MRYIVLICARGGSKGLPGKNIKLLGGIPLIGWSINIAKKLDNVSRIIVSTDSNKIAETAKKFGAEVPFIRPKSLAKDTSPEWLVWRHAINFIEEIDNDEVDALIVLPATAPLRSVEDINACIKKFENSKADSVITICEANRSPFFNMVVKNENDYASLVIPSKNKINRRQDAPKVYDMTTVAYVVNVEFIKKHDGIFEGKVKSITIPQERSMDIDTLLDFKVVESFLNQQE